MESSSLLQVTSTFSISSFSLLTSFYRCVFLFLFIPDMSGVLELFEALIDPSKTDQVSMAWLVPLPESAHNKPYSEYAKSLLDGESAQDSSSS